ncbi:hypothetical protein [Faecalimicrobium sp. JNUCC 81]
MKNSFMPLLMALSIGLLHAIKNIYIFIIVFTGLSIYMVYNAIKSIINIKTCKIKTFSKIDLYYREQKIGVFIFLAWIFMMLFVNWKLDINYVLENFYKASFNEQYLFIAAINSSVWLICPLIVCAYVKVKSKNEILYKEGVLFGDGKLYSFDSVKSYEFKTSWKGIKYNNLVLTFDNKAIKTLYIYNEDIDKFKDLLERR